VFYVIPPTDHYKTSGWICFGRRRRSSLGEPAGRFLIQSQLANAERSVATQLATKRSFPGALVISMVNDMMATV
jgi:hypothetical protein